MVRNAACLDGQHCFFSTRVLREVCEQLVQSGKQNHALKELFLVKKCLIGRIKRPGRELLLSCRFSVEPQGRDSYWMVTKKLLLVSCAPVTAFTLGAKLLLRHPIRAKFTKKRILKA